MYLKFHEVSFFQFLLTKHERKTPSYLKKIYRNFQIKIFVPDEWINEDISIKKKNKEDFAISSLCLIFFISRDFKIKENKK